MKNKSVHFTHRNFASRLSIPNFGIEFAVCVSFILISAVAILTLTGHTNPFSNYYNSYSLQAARWLSGHLDLGQDYSHLEIARFNEKYFVSFPPFPSVVMLPFVCIFGVQTPDSIISVVFACMSALFALKIAYFFDIRGIRAIFWTLFLTLCSNFLSIMSFGWVWFIAQTMSFSFLLASVYFMLCQKPGLSFIALSFAAGCRPFCLIYFPFILLFLLKKGKKIPEILISLIPAALVGLFYMFLNLMRFGNPLEFGHNFLPEFLEAENGQFSLYYMPENIKNLFRIPFSKASMNAIKFNGFAFFLVSPIYVAYVFLFIKSKKTPLEVLLGTLIIFNLLFLTMHKTMGGWHFGNRYTIDALPFVYLGCMLANTDGTDKIFIPSAIFGFILNFAGTIWIFGA